jgi:homoserine O-acetyltransferase
MNQLTNTMLLCVALLFAFNSFSQSEQKFAHLGDFTTTEGKLIKDCKIGYRTVGELNANKSNVVLWPTWFTGTSEHVFSFGAINTMIDTEGLYIVVVDALTNGVSSSPSNSSEFPTVSIRDMVNSQHSLLVNHLNIEHVKAVMGVSLGGMQTYEWAVAYPDFMDQVIPIIGSPKQSSYDILVWQTMADLIIEAGQDKEQLDFAYKRAHNIC